MCLVVFSCALARSFGVLSSGSIAGVLNAVAAMCRLGFLSSQGISGISRFTAMIQYYAQVETASSEEKEKKRNEEKQKSSVH